MIERTSGRNSPATGRRHTRRVLPLSGFSIGVTGHRRADEQADMLVKRGATAVVGTVMQSVPIDDLDATITRHAPDRGRAGGCHRAVDRGRDADRGSAWPSSPAWTTTCGGPAASALVLARGPKARSAAMAGGIDVSWQAPGETGVEIVEHLEQLGVVGKRVAVQRDGGVDLPHSLAAMIRELGADVVEVPVYRWKLPDDLQPAQRLIAAVADGAHRRRDVHVRHRRRQLLRAGPGRGRARRRPRRAVPGRDGRSGHRGRAPAPRRQPPRRARAGPARLDDPGRGRGVRGTGPDG